MEVLASFSAVAVNRKRMISGVVGRSSSHKRNERNPFPTAAYTAEPPVTL